MRNDHRSCRGCYWYDNCLESRPCEYYYPITSPYEDIIFDIQMLRDREEFNKEYEDYLTEWER